MKQIIECNFCRSRATTIEYGKSWCDQCIDEEKEAKRKQIKIILVRLLFIMIGIAIGRHIL